MGAQWSQNFCFVSGLKMLDFTLITTFVEINVKCGHKSYLKNFKRSYFNFFQPKISKKQLEILKTVFLYTYTFSTFLGLGAGGRGWGGGLYFGKSKYLFTALQLCKRMLRMVQTQTNSKHRITGDVGDRTRGLLIADQTLYH
jgi:hypothetical protein